VVEGGRLIGGKVEVGLKEDREGGWVRGKEGGEKSMYGK
jgi:hypothetical protein